MAGVFCVRASGRSVVQAGGIFSEYFMDICGMMGKVHIVVAYL
jgi:hypothetical protein